MDLLGDLAAAEPFAVWDGVLARSEDGERAGRAGVELEPASVAPEHSHENEQLAALERVGPQAPRWP